MSSADKVGVMTSNASPQRVLDAERDRLANLRLEVSDEVGLGQAITDATGELAVLDQDSADGAAILYERELATQLVGLISMRADQFDRAIERHQNGNYGLCEACGERIPAARLAVMPEATTCVPCQSKRERRPALDSKAWN